VDPFRKKHPIFYPVSSDYTDKKAGVYKSFREELQRYFSASLKDKVMIAKGFKDIHLGLDLRH
jgi:hypothetical protein